MKVRNTAKPVLEDFDHKVSSIKAVEVLILEVLFCEEALSGYRFIIVEMFIKNYFNVIP